MTPSNADIAADFAEVARGFCAWCEGTSLGLDPEATAALWLARLYAAAIALPGIDTDNPYQYVEVQPEALATATENLADFNGMYYRECFDPDPRLVEDPVMGDVGDDLLDTYTEIRSGLQLHDGGQPSEAIGHWAFSHRIHWGRHAVGALFALHCMSISKRE